MRVEVARHVLAGLLVLALPLTAGAQEIYKCKSASGGTTYQQTPCADAAKTQSVRTFQRVPDSPRAVTHARRAPQASQHYSYEPARNTGTAATIGTAGVMQNQQRYPTREEEAEQKRAQRRAAREASGDRTAFRPEVPTVVTDQTGRRYQKPPGSNIVTDERTGKQCFLVGDFLQCN